ncbi:hypothetical protein PI125_g3772 [Phytophthora idaei]|nr:hypothetical protein PI125_g3772 [Phytophthora idaei]
MIIAVGRDVDVLSAPLERDGVAHQLWKQTPWTLAESLDTNTNTALGNIDGKGPLKKRQARCENAGEKIRLEHRPAYDALCSAFITCKANGGIVDRCTPDSHQWKQKDLEL